MAKGLFKPNQFKEKRIGKRGKTKKEKKKRLV
jgi:hypothetical protein